MEFTNFEEFLSIRLDSGILEQWSNDLKNEEEREEKLAQHEAIKNLLKEIEDDE